MSLAVQDILCILLRVNHCANKLLFSLTYSYLSLYAQVGCLPCTCQNQQESADGCDFALTACARFASIEDFDQAKVRTHVSECDYVAPFSLLLISSPHKKRFKAGTLFLPQVSYTCSATNANQLGYYGSSTPECLYVFSQFFP